MKTTRALPLLALGSLLLPATAGAATLVATYDFQNTLNANQGGVPALTAVDPLAQSGFLVDSAQLPPVTVYHFSGDTVNQAGLSLNTTGLVTPNSYSVELNVKFDTHGGTWDRLLDTLDRTSDSGFYVDPFNHLQIYPVAPTGTHTYTDGYHDIILSVASDGTVKAYYDGALDFTVNTTLMNLSNSATNTLNIFLDNTTGGPTGDYSPGKVARVQLFNGALSDAEASAVAQSAPTPEPTSALLLALGLPALLGLRRRTA